MTKRWCRRVAVVLLAGMLLGCLALAGLNGWVLHRARPWLRTPEEVAGLEADCILVLGAGLWAPGVASPMLADRLQRAMDLWALGAGQTLLMSGDQGSGDYNEVAVMRDWALAAGAPAAQVLVDPAGYSTYESMVRAQTVYGCERIVIVTQQYHLYRAVYIAQSLGMEAYGVAAEEIVYPNQLWRSVREVLARAKDVVFCLLRPEITEPGAVEMRDSLQAKSSLCQKQLCFPQKLWTIHCTEVH